MPCNDSPEESKVRRGVDVNIYATRKTVAHGMLDIALLTANASQLKYTLSFSKIHDYFATCVTLIALSIALQIGVGILLILVGRWNINCVRDQKKAELYNNVIVLVTFAITVVNVLISAFAPDGIEEEDPRVWPKHPLQRFERAVPANCSYPAAFIS